MSDNNIFNELSDAGFINSEELNKSVAFLTELKLPDSDKLFLYKEFKSELNEFDATSLKN